MSRYIRKIGPKWWWACGLTLWLITLVGVRANSHASAPGASVTGENSAEPSNLPRSSRQAQKPAPAAADYVGEDTCLGCHDGTVALNAFGGNTGSSEFLRSGPAFLGTNLSNDHPISFIYDTKLAADDGGLYDPKVTIVPLLDGQTIQKGMLIKDEIQCTSCHDVHAVRSPASQGGGMLLLSNNGSALCLTCHRK